jgi:hypothetical protein
MCRNNEGIGVFKKMISLAFGEEDVILEYKKII